MSTNAKKILLINDLPGYGKVALGGNGADFVAYGALSDATSDSSDFQYTGLWKISDSGYDRLHEGYASGLGSAWA